MVIMNKYLINSCRHSLKYPPLKSNIKKFPETIVWFSDKNPHYYDFVAASTTSIPSKICKMYCSKYDRVAEDKVLPSLMIHMIKSVPQKQGLGTVMLNIAKKFSQQIGCEGRLTLKAVSQFTPDDLPHIFYRKYGFNTLDTKVNKKLDCFIAKNKKATKDDFQDIMMYYPPVKTEDKNQSKITKLSDYLKFKVLR